MTAPDRVDELRRDRDAFRARLAELSVDELNAVLDRILETMDAAVRALRQSAEMNTRRPTETLYDIGYKVWENDELIETDLVPGYPDTRQAMREVLRDLLDYLQVGYVSTYRDRREWTVTAIRQIDLGDEDDMCGVVEESTDWDGDTIVRRTEYEVILSYANDADDEVTR